MGLYPRQTTTWQNEDDKPNEAQEACVQNCINKYRRYSVCDKEGASDDCFCKDDNYIQQYGGCVDKNCWSDAEIRDNFGLSVPIILTNQCAKFNVTLNQNLFVGMKSGIGTTVSYLPPTPSNSLTTYPTGTPAAPDKNGTTSTESSNMPAIIGGSVGGGTAIIIAAVLGFILLRRKAKKKGEKGVHVPTHYPNASSLAPTAIASFSPHSQQTHTESKSPHDYNGYYSPPPDGYVSPPFSDPGTGQQWQQSLYPQYTHNATAPAELSGQQVRVPSPAHGANSGWQGAPLLGPLAELGDGSSK